jgi:hypothetical protein
MVDYLMAARWALMDTALEHRIAAYETHKLLAFHSFIISHLPWLITSTFWTFLIEILGLA